ncbi:MAG: Era-like GTP-binding protein [Candidatus Aenigmatarchaeota archaeon]
MKFNFLDWIYRILGIRRNLKIGIYGETGVGKTTLANRISLDWTGEEIGKVTGIPHETRSVQKKEKIEIKVGKKKILLSILDMPGLSTKVDYRAFLKYGLSKKEARERARQATEGVIEAIKWLSNVDAVLAVMDSTRDPLTQVNITLLGNLEARNIPVIIVANKIDKKKAKPHLIKEAFPTYPVVEVSALKGKNMESLYEAIAKHLR